MKHEFNTTGKAVLGDSTLVKPERSLTVDVQKYQAYLDGSDMTNEQKEEFLQALWSIIVNFVELGFGIHPVQEVCGKDHQSDTHAAKEAYDEVNSDHTKSEINPLDSVPRDSLDVE